MEKKLVLIIDNQVLRKYYKYYFNKYPKRKVKPIISPIHPSLNKWIIMNRMAMNSTKAKWKEFIVWFVEDQKLTNRLISRCSMIFIDYFKTKIRKDTDNTVPKFILDGFVVSKLIIDDDSSHLTSLTLMCDYDRENPRTEIIIIYEE